MTGAARIPGRIRCPASVMAARCGYRMLASKRWSGSRTAWWAFQAMKYTVSSESPM